MIHKMSQAWLVARDQDDVSRLVHALNSSIHFCVTPILEVDAKMYNVDQA
jgi:hypothetical protein